MAGIFGQALAGALGGTALVDGVSVPGAADANIGVPGDANVKCERSLHADSELLIAHGSNEEIEQALAAVERSGAVDAGSFEAAGEDASEVVTG